MTSFQTGHAQIPDHSHMHIDPTAASPTEPLREGGCPHMYCIIVSAAPHCCHEQMYEPHMHRFYLPYTICTSSYYLRTLLEHKRY